MITVNRITYWQKLVDYYYDYIHWSDSDTRSSNTMPNWLQNEYSIKQSADGHSLEFTDSKKYTYFMLRWS
jgi:hypothetical protein